MRNSNVHKKAVSLTKGSKRSRNQYREPRQSENDEEERSEGTGSLPWRDATKGKEGKKDKRVNMEKKKGKPAKRRKRLGRYVVLKNPAGMEPYVTVGIAR